MDLQQLSIKVFGHAPNGAPDGFDQAPVIPIFHRWIREKRLGDALLIDVADYRHVPDGPGVMLIAHEAHYSLDTRAGELGLVYAQKRDPVGPAADKLQRAVRAALHACHAVEGEPSVALRFNGADIDISINSRLVAPNTDDTFETFRPIVDQFATRLYDGASFEISRADDPKRPFGVRVRAHGEHPIPRLLERLQA